MADLHSYASRERDHVPSDVALFAAAALASYGIYQVLDALNPFRFEIPAPSMFGFFAVFRLAYRRWVWRWPIVRRIIGIRNLQATYVGTVRVFTPSEQAEYPRGVPKLCVLTIVQTLYTICITMQTRAAESSSDTASMLVTPGTKKAELAYYYHAVGRDSGKLDFVPHDGTAWLRQTRVRQFLVYGTELPKWWQLVRRFKRLRRGRQAWRLNGPFFTDRPQHTGAVDVMFLTRKALNFDEVDFATLPSEIVTAHREAIDRENEAVA